MSKILNSKILKIIIDVIETMVIAFAIVFFLFVILQKTVFKDKDVFGFNIYTIVSDSMEPDIHVGDVILSKKIDPNEVKVGDIVTYKGMESDYAGKIVTHQVKDILKKPEGGKLYYTYGINNKGMMDPAISGEQILSKYVYKIKTVSLVSRLVRSVFGIFILVLVVAVFIFIKKLINKSHNLNNKEDKKKDEPNKEIDVKTDENTGDEDLEIIG